MGGLEAVLTGIQDEFRPFFKKYRFSREIFTGIVIIGAVVLALPNVTNVSGCKIWQKSLLWKLFLCKIAKVSQTSHN